MHDTYKIKLIDLDELRAVLTLYRPRGLFLCRLIPVLRTISSIPAGLFRIPAGDFLLWSGLGITVWNSVLIGFGYLGANVILSRI